jgi:ribosomal protein L11 methyltransferase
MHTYLAIHCQVTPRDPFAEILISQLAAIGFEMFEENDAGFDGFVRKDNFNQEALLEIEYLAANEWCQTVWSLEDIPGINWNAEWEKNFNPVRVKNILIRAPFHNSDDTAELDLIIQPKMSFGTGHHATTSLMVEYMLELDFSGKTVLDMGCGSGILGILACKLGAAEVIAVDNDENCVVNSIENITANKVQQMEVLLGDATVLNMMHFDIILANINRNILLQDIESYVKVMKSETYLLVSGFLVDDIPTLIAAFEIFQIKKIQVKVQANWCAILFKR